MVYAVYVFFLRAIILALVFGALTPPDNMNPRLDQQIFFMLTAAFVWTVGDYVLKAMED